MTTMQLPDLPEPECIYGYPEDQLRSILGDRWEEFFQWFRGQTAAICDGRQYDHEKKEYHETGCGPHGMVVYPWDVKRFLGGGRPLD